MSRRERLLVLWLAITFLLCVFVSLPDDLTSGIAPVRRAARTYLRTAGLDQYWRMFVGDDWDIPQLRITATDASGLSRDVTNLFVHRGVLYRHILDDHLTIAHFYLAHGQKPELLASYANTLRVKLGPQIRQVRFEGVYRDSPTRTLATYMWD